MIIFHEGLPRSGKSYEALKERVIPALKARRPVVAYVEGIGSEDSRRRIADLAGVSYDECCALLTALTREQCQHIDEHAVENALYVLDEAQNFWPNGREKLSPAMTEFVTEHGHHGRDIVLMGQDIRDVHALWRRRCEIKLAFLKLSAIGQENRYSITTFRNVGKDRFEKVNTSVSKYDPAFFGTYKSHVADDINKSNYKDSRALLFSGAAFKYGLPLVLVGAVWGAVTAWKFFHPAPPVRPAVASPQQGAAVAATAGAPTTAPAPSAKPDTRSVQERRFADLSGRSRIRLAGVISMGSRTSGYVEWVDGNAHVVERLSFDALRDLGVAVVLSESAVRLALGGWFDMATTWPLEAEGRVSEARQETIRPPREAGDGMPTGAVSLSGSRQPAPSPREPAAPLSVDSRRGV